MWIWAKTIPSNKCSQLYWMCYDFIGMTDGWMTYDYDRYKECEKILERLGYIRWINQ